MNKKYMIYEMGGYRYVLTDCPRQAGADQANFAGTGKALAGILYGKETLNSFLKERERMKPIIKERVERLMRLRYGQ